MKAIKVKEVKQHKGRTYFPGKQYKTVDREARDDDEINKHHAAEMVNLELAHPVEARTTRPKRATAKRKPAAKRKAAAQNPAQSEPVTEKKGEGEKS